MKKMIKGERESVRERERKKKVSSLYACVYACLHALRVKECDSDEKIKKKHTHTVETACPPKAVRCTRASRKFVSVTM